MTDATTPVQPAKKKTSKFLQPFVVLFWPLAKFFMGIAWLKKLSDKMGYAPVSFSIVVIWSILKIFNFNFLGSWSALSAWIAAAVFAIVAFIGFLLEARQSTSARFSFNKLLYDQLFALITVTLGTLVFVLVFVYRRGIWPGDFFIFLMYMSDGVFGPYIYLRSNYRSFIGTGIGTTDHDQQTVSVGIDGGHIDHPHSA